MAIRISGPYKALDILARQFRKAASKALLREMSKQLGQEALSQVQLGFRQSRDPYGTPWKPPQLRPGQPLLDRGRLRASFASRPVASGFEVSSNAKYASIHQEGGLIVPRNGKFLVFRSRLLVFRFGAKAGKAASKIFARRVRIPQRMMLPTSSRGLGPIWSKAFDRVARPVIAVLFERRR